MDRGARCRPGSKPRCAAWTPMPTLPGPAPQRPAPAPQGLLAAPAPGPTPSATEAAMSQQLALFELPPGPAPRAGDRQPVIAPAQAGHAPMAVKTRDKPTAPAATAPASLLAPVEFRHPRARPELRLGDAVVAYALERLRRCGIGFAVGPDGLAVRALGWVTLGAVDAALREKADWILRKLSEARQRQQRLESARIVWAD